MDVFINFLADWKNYMLADIRYQGYQISQDEPLDIVSYKFFNIRRRRIEALPRKVHESSEFICPAAYQDGYDALKAKLIAGDDVTPHLSKNLLRIYYEDSLLNDWGIYHFHLGKKTDFSGFIDRTEILLFAIITINDVYCIGVFPHGVWFEQELIRVIHRNWPAVIEPFLIKGIVGISRPVLNEDIKKLRKAGIQTMVEVEPGVVYAPIGGGYSTAGTSVKATMQSNRYHHLIQSLENYVRENLILFLEKISELGMVAESPPSFSLLVNERGFYAVEVGSRMIFFLRPHS